MYRDRGFDRQTDQREDSVLRESFIPSDFSRIAQRHGTLIYYFEFALDQKTEVRSDSDKGLTVDFDGEELSFWHKI